MTTKKFSTFEYTLETYEGGGDNTCMDSFETPHGHVFVIALAGEDKVQAGLAATAVERIKYYFESEPDDKAADICKNALVYTGGYLYQHGQGDPGRKPDGISCICLLFDGENIHYSGMGDVCMSVLAGKKMHSLIFCDNDGPDGALPGKGSYLGDAPVAEPQASLHPSSPARDDILLFGAGELCGHIMSRQLKKILMDSMPLQTKLARVMRHVRDQGGRQPSTACMICFYGMAEGHGNYWKGDMMVKSDSARGKSGKKSTKQGARNGRITESLRYAIMALLIVFVGYMFYDLFIYDPRPPVAVPLARQEAADTDTLLEEPEDTGHPDMLPPFPGDVNYTVRGGDTWNRIYLQFGVCSWFIINHPPNTGRFGRDGGLIAGQTLRIPVRYSGDPDLNPHYYTEFTLDRVGSSCENAGREFREAFEEKYSGVSQ